MEPILSRQEIADLLQTLQQGGRPFSEGGPRVSEYPEINLFEESRRRPQGADLANLDLVIEGFRDHFRTSLSSLLQRTVEVSTTAMQTGASETFSGGENRWGVGGVFNLSPLQREATVCFDRPLSFALLEALLGGEVHSLEVPERASTRLEMRMLSLPLKLAGAALVRAFSPVVTIAGELVRTANDLTATPFHDPDTVVLVSTFEIAVDRCAGTMELVLPVADLTYCREALAKLSRFSRRPGKAQLDRLSPALGAMPITLMARGGVTNLSVRQLLELEVGTVIPLTQEPGTRLDILVEGVAKFSAEPGSRGQTRSARITAITH